MADRTGGRGKCAVCQHDQQDAINAALVAGSPSLGKLAEQYGITKTSLIRHKASHLSPALARVQAERLEKGATTVITRLERLVRLLEAVIYPAEKEDSPNLSLALSAMREYRTTMELLAKVTGELDERPTTVVNIAASVEWIEVRSVVLRALRPHPVAMRAVADALERIA
jgi:hypothetical protein